MQAASLSPLPQSQYLSAYGFFTLRLQMTPLSIRNTGRMSQASGTIKSAAHRSQRLSGVVGGALSFQYNSLPKFCSGSQHPRFLLFHI